MNKNKLKLLIEEHLHADLENINYPIKQYKATELLTHNRFDLGFKIFYLKNYKKIPELANRVYEANISACTFGKFNEYGDETKQSFDDFCNAFKSTYSNLKKFGFNIQESIIPLSNNGTIINGAHRLASSLLLNINVGTVSINSKDHAQDYTFFMNRGVPKYILDIAANEFIAHSKNIFVALLWPSAIGKNKKIHEIIGDVVYSKEIKLNKNGAHNLISQVYKGEEWLGSQENNYQGAHAKLIKCFDNPSPLTVIVFNSKSITDVKKAKEKIRNLFNLGKHSVHITDHNHEAVAISKLLFNDNALHFINYASPNKYKNNYKKISIFSNFIKDNSLKKEDVVIDSGMVLSIYGIRQANDIDYISSRTKINHKNKLIDNHVDQIKYHKLDKNELLYNPLFFFYFNGLKFVSLKQLFFMKKNRGNDKDVIDCRMIEALLVMKKFNINKINYYLLYQKSRIIVSIIQLLKIMKIHRFVRSIYKMITCK